ncbi:MAG: alginate export family protein [Bdellovibrionales bacterium]
MSKQFLATTLIVLTSLAATPAYAAPARHQTISDTPVPVTTFSAEELRNTDILRSLTELKVDLEARARYENAEQEGLLGSDANTLGAKLGITTLPVRGLYARGAVESVIVPFGDRYANGVNSLGGTRSTILDPATMEVSEAYIGYVREFDLSNIDVLKGPHGTLFETRVGRQTLNFDDGRWIGAADWRQNRSNYDAAYGSLSFGQAVDFRYSYVDARRNHIGHENADGIQNSDSHLFNFGTGLIPYTRASAFGYIVDMDDENFLSSNTYGLRTKTDLPLNLLDKGLDPFAFKLDLSYARQTDAGTNPNDYSLNYYMAKPGLWYTPNFMAGRLFTQFGYEVFEGDNTTSVTTPWASNTGLSRHNGLTDAITTGVIIPEGLVDRSVSFGYKVDDIWPTCNLFNDAKLRFEWHDFGAETNDADYGDEWNVTYKQELGSWVTMDTGFGSFNAADGSPFNDTDRFFVQFTLKLQADRNGVTGREKSFDWGTVRPSF